MNVNFEFFSIDFTTVIGVLINTFILFLLFKKFLFGPVNKIIDERKEQVSKTYKDADAALENAKSLEAEYQGKLESAKEESDRRIKEASRKAQARSEEIISQAKSEAADIVSKANADIERERKRAVSQIKDEISDIAVSIAGKVISKEIAPSKEQDRLIDEFIGNLGTED